jgi:hypothetical protein
LQHGVNNYFFNYYLTFILDYAKLVAKEGWGCTVKNCGDPYIVGKGNRPGSEVLIKFEQHRQQQHSNEPIRIIYTLFLFKVVY